MKKTLTAMGLLAGAACAYSQGQIWINDYNPTFAIQIFTGSSIGASTVAVSYGAYTTLEQQGNNLDDDNPGSAIYTGTPLGAGYDVQLLAAPGSGDALASLLPVASPIAAWAPEGMAGFWDTDAYESIPGVGGAGGPTVATVAIAAWDNEGGTVNSVVAAQVAGAPWGISDTATTAPILQIGVPPHLPPGLTSFSLGIDTVPEPSTMALGIVGASAFLMRLRRNQ